MQNSFIYSFTIILHTYFYLFITIVFFYFDNDFAIFSELVCIIEHI